MGDHTVGIPFIVELAGEQYEIGSAIMSEADWQRELPSALRQLADATDASLQSAPCPGSSS